jgi:hypothetical protein
VSCSSVIFNPANPNVLEWGPVTNNISDAVVTSAVVVVTILNAQGDEVDGQTWPATMPHIADGLYRVVLETDIDILPRRAYTAHIVATVSGEPMADISVPVKVMTRTG